VQFSVISLYLARLPGNRFVNGIIFGFGDCFAIVFSQYLMNNMMDMTAFYVCYALGLVSYLALIFFSHINAVTYVANLLIVTSMGGWFNIQFLILEMRVPHQIVGSFSALSRTIAVGSAVVAPMIASMDAPYPYICLMILATLGMVLTFALPPPG